MTLQTKPKLPPGQHEIDTFPRFGLTPFATRFPVETEVIKLKLAIRNRPEVEAAFDVEVEVGARLESLPRVEQLADFHCVTTWTRRDLRWGGVRFADFYQHIVVPLTDPATPVTFVVLRGQDGARTSMPLEDLLAPQVLLADRLFGEPLSIEHGAPLRLVAPAHYGYKSVKHLERIEFRSSAANYRPFGLRFMVHPRARVALEERGQWLPGWLLRHLYRPLIGSTVRHFEQAMRQRRLQQGAKADPTDAG